MEREEFYRLEMDRLRFAEIATWWSTFFSRCRLKKIQDKKQIARGKVEAARAARRLQQDVPDVANMVEEEIDEDIVI